jgi:uncharacterized repeat protein (TIGR01451 family)
MPTVETGASGRIFRPKNHEGEGAMIQLYKRLLAAGAATALLVLVVGGVATAADPPGVTPKTVTGTLLPGESLPPIDKVVQTSEIPPNPDLVFLADTTGSMGGAITDVRNNAAAVMNDVLLAQPTANFGAASYKDFTNSICAPDPYVFRVDAALTSLTGDVQTGINSWSAFGGCDTPEADLFGLESVANTFGWRPGSSRIIAWFGDAPGHDPSGTSTLATATAALVAQGIRVIAVNVGNLDALGQATAITTATGGTLLNGVSSDDVSDAILEGLHSLPVTVTSAVGPCDPQLHVTLVPPSASGTSGDAFHFTETVTVDPTALGGTYSCHVSFLINGVPAGSDFDESITITVPSPDLTVAKSGPSATTEGNNVTYTLLATNNGPTTATGVTVSDAVPANSTFVSASPGCALAAGVVTCTAGTLASGASQAFSVTVKAGSGSSIVNTATIGGDQADPNGGNNSSTVTTSVNHNPICSGASAGPDLWPPNHKMVAGTITGVTDADGNPISVTITGIWQDEPTNGLGDGDTAVDGQIGSGNSFSVRAERAGTRNGRVYHVLFSASDGAGGSCSGSATIGVPHDQGPGGGPVDDGALYNSLL